MEFAARSSPVTAARRCLRGCAGLFHTFICGTGHGRNGGNVRTRRGVRGRRRIGQHFWRAVPSGEVQRARPPDSAQFRCRDARLTMLSKRLIACLDVRNGCVVKGVNFEGLRNAGDPAALAKRYNQEGIDEVVVLDVTATLEGRRAFEATIRAVSSELFIPLTVGGGIRTESDAAAAIDAGADKV